ncbi:formate dehydrogenase accessory sulfurtransferase FdhD [Aureibacter tunicatorum]|uniref:Sulfur carrier protein FdhD n=1 Tax=Aureibacter tunicatorum TaxID=866807 RepID=A0AAE3XS83_9BACT|nr:formate dehydrogenase accessory sulfurtransferase FdhD [Aureibacter tunicatorum]MDR6240544.1 FdhD protein [Aureibacter tunicatorum]BDD06595.1 sulfurtransferase FdhD [Aureibacter tunicatorum]
METLETKGIKFVDGETEIVEDFLTVEAPLQINVNHKPYTVTMRTPGADEYLVRGLLHAEEVYQGDEALTVDIVSNKFGGETIVNVNIPKEKLGSGYARQRTLVSVSSCGVCGKRELGDLEYSMQELTNEKQLNIESLESMFDKMSQYQASFHKSGGCHAASIFNNSGEMLAVKEDIGRHNAVDKVIGEILQLGLSSESDILLVSGRVSYEVLTKTSLAKIPILAAISAPSSMAVASAESMGITLLAFCRKGKATCYTHSGRVRVPSDELI